MYPHKLEFGLKNKLLLVFIIVFLTVLVFTAYMGVSALNMAKKTSVDVGNTILLEQNRTYFKNYTDAQKNTLELLVKTIEDDVLNLQDFAIRIFSHEQWVNTKAYWDHTEHLTVLDNNQLVEKATDISTLWSPSWMEINNEVMQKIELSAFLNEVFVPIFARNEKTVASYFIGEEGFVRYYPRMNMLSTFPTDYNPKQAIFYQVATPENNPRRQLVWTPLYKDPAGLGLMLSAVAPIYVKGEFMGVIGTDITLEKLVKHQIKEDELGDGYSILLDHDFRPIALPEQANHDVYGKNLAADDKLISQSLLQFESDFKDVFNRIKDQNSGFEKITIKGKVYYMSFVKLKKLNWLYANIISENTMLSVTKSLSEEIDDITDSSIVRYTLPTIAIFILMLGFISWLVNRFLRPIEQLSDVTRTIAFGHFEEDINIKAADEINVLVENFTTMQKAIIKQKRDLLEFNTSLQDKVEERTEAIEASNEALQTMVHNLKYMQQQMIESEKMASLGTLTAGVAHEINNPTNFVHVSVQNLQTDIKKLQDFLFNLLDADDDDEIVQSFNEHFDILYSHIDTVIDGSVRIRGIVKNLKSFTHPDAEEKKPFHIGDALESTLNLIKTKFQGLVNFETRLEENPVLLCYPSELNQVFMNIIVNACEAIRDRTQNRDVQGEVIVCCFVREQNVVITVEDNGCGMSEKTKQRIFEPFYTTKDVGEGTGLGMSISYGIIQKHQGEMVVESQVNVGTLFTISIPICAQSIAIAAIDSKPLAIGLEK